VSKRTRSYASPCFGGAKRSERYIIEALRESIRSDYKRVRIGAVIVNKRGIIAKGYNITASHPMQKFWNDHSGRIANGHSCHAEMAALVRAKDRDVRGATMYVARFNRNGALGMCRPCVACAAAIRGAGIHTIVFTTTLGVQHEQVQSR